MPFGGKTVAQPGLTDDDPRSAPYVARVRASRVVEVHVRRLASVSDVESLHGQVSAAVRRAGPRSVICADHRFASPLSREVADALSRNMRENNGTIVLGALLLDPANAMYNLQLERVVRCAANPARRLFVNVEELRDWVRDALTEPEREALRALFS